MFCRNIREPKAGEKNWRKSPKIRKTRAQNPGNMKTEGAEQNKGTKTVGMATVTAQLGHLTGPVSRTVNAAARKMSEPHVQSAVMWLCSSEATLSCPGVSETDPLSPVGSQRTRPESGCCLGSLEAE